MSILRVFNRQLRMLRHPLFVAILGKMRYNVWGQGGVAAVQEGYYTKMENDELTEVVYGNKNEYTDT